MARISVRTNAKDVAKRLSKREERAEKDITRLILKSVNMVHATVINGIQGPPATGRMRPDGSRASAAGEYPMTDQSTLVQNISKDIATTGFTGRVTSSAKHGPHLEFGTMNMLPRPFMQPSLEQNRRKILQGFKDAKLLRRKS